jgi:hypothetical protein
VDKCVVAFVHTVLSVQIVSSLALFSVPNQFDSLTMKRQRLVCATPCGSVKLNVGGKQFEVSQETLNAFGYIRARLANEHTDVDEEIFVDRDPTYFEILLQAVRTFSRPPQKDIDAYKQHLLAECAFFCVSDWLSEAIIGKICNHLMRQQDQKIRAAEISGDVEVVDPFQAAFEQGNATDLGSVWLQSNGDRPYFDCASVEMLKSRLDMLSGGLVGKLQGVQGILDAGGAIVAALGGGKDCCTDFDLFLACSPTEGLSKVRSIYEACRQTVGGGKTNLMVIRTSFSVTIFRSYEPVPLPIQVLCFSSVGSDAC